MSCRRVGWSLIALIPVVAALADAPEKSSGRYDFLGVVDRLDASNRTIVIRRGRKPHYEQVAIRYDANTEIVRAKRAARASDIRPALRIWVYLREDGSGRKTDLARRLTLADPYPDVYGVIESIDARANTIVVSRNYPGGGAKDRRQTLMVRVNRDTRITLEGRTALLKDVPIGRRVAITSVRGSDCRAQWNLATKKMQNRKTAISF